MLFGRIGKALHRMGHDIAGRLNLYRCTKCGRVVVTIDRHKGTTPYMVTCCEFGGECDGQAHSAFYAKVAQTMVPTHEWYAPTPNEVAAIRQGGDADELYHVLAGGLLLRKIPDGAAV